MHLIANTDDLAMTTIFSQMKDEVYQVFTSPSTLARQTFGITLHIRSSSFQGRIQRLITFGVLLFSDHHVLPQPFDVEDGHSDVELDVVNGPWS